MRISNYHTHIYLCKHATGTIEEYVKKAISLNYQHIGISDHAPFDDELTKLIHSRRMSEEDLEKVYFPTLELVKTAFSDKITVLRAVEIEYFGNYLSQLTRLRKKLDYMILGQHYIFKNGKYLSIYDRNISKEDILIYQDMVIEAMNTKLFKILAHPEIFTFSYKTYDQTVETIFRNIITSAIANNVYLELNANGIRDAMHKNGGIYNEEDFKYPNYHFWKIVSEVQQTNPNLKVIINDDSHTVESFDDEFTKYAYEFAEKYNIKISDKMDI